MNTPDNSVTDVTENKPVSQAQHVVQLAADINTFMQLAMFCGMATVSPVLPTVQLTLGNHHRTTLFLSSGKLMVALTEHAERMQASLTERGIDTDELLAEVANSIKILTKQNGG